MLHWWFKRQDSGKGGSCRGLAHSNTWHDKCWKSCEQALWVNYTSEHMSTNRLLSKSPKESLEVGRLNGFRNCSWLSKLGHSWLGKFHKGRTAASSIHTLCSELRNYEFSRGKKGFVCWKSHWNDSRYKWKKRKKKKKGSHSTSKPL